MYFGYEGMDAAGTNSGENW